MADLGCGRGAGTIYLSELLKTRQQNGLDYNESLIQYCARGYQYNNLGRKINWCLLDACALHEEVKAGMLDLIFFVQGLHQIRSPALFFKEIAVTLKPTSRLILADFFFDCEGLK
jgi:SAM-dependent methyltransferase